MTENSKKLVQSMKAGLSAKREDFEMVLGMSMADMLESIEELIREGVIEEPYSHKGCVVTE